MNSLRKAICSRSMVCPRYRHVSASGITAACQKSKQNASLLLWVISTYFSPHRRGFYLRIARRQQQLRLVRLQYPRRFGARRPPLEPSFGQSLRRQPEPLAIVLQDSDGRSTTGAENEQVAGKRIGVQFLPAQLGDCINALASVNSLNRNQNPYLRRDLDHTGSHKLRLNPARSSAVGPFHWMRILPRGPSNSIRHSDRDPAGATWVATNSKKSVGGAGLRLTGASDVVLRFS